MSDPKRYHPPERISDHPAIQQAFTALGAVLIATKSKDLEADFTMEDEAGHKHQFHVEVAEVQE